MVWGFCSKSKERYFLKQVILEYYFSPWRVNRNWDSWVIFKCIKVIKKCMWLALVDWVDSNSPSDLGQTACPLGLVSSLAECKVTRRLWGSQQVQSLAQQPVQGKSCCCHHGHCESSSRLPLTLSHSPLSPTIWTVNYFFPLDSRGRWEKKWYEEWD